MQVAFKPVPWKKWLYLGHFLFYLLINSFYQPLSSNMLIEPPKKPSLFLKGEVGNLQQKPGVAMLQLSPLARRCQEEFLGKQQRCGTWENEEFHPLDLDPHGLIQMIFHFKGVMIQVPFALSFWGSIIWIYPPNPGCWLVTTRMALHF